MHISADWNMISLVSQPDPMLDSNTNGIGDITQSLFFSPVHSGALIWRAGPVFTVPSATDPILGTGRVLLGRTAVFLVTPGHAVIGVLLNNQWSVDGNPLRPPVNAFVAQPFANYNMAHGWYLTSSPVITANGLAAPGQQWTVPIGGGFETACQCEYRRLLQRDNSDWRTTLAITRSTFTSVPGEIAKRLGKCCLAGDCAPIICPFRSRVIGVGPQIRYLFPVGDTQGYLNLKGYGEFHNNAKPDGWNVWPSFVLSPKAPAAAASPPPILTK